MSQSYSIESNTTFAEYLVNASLSQQYNGSMLKAEVVPVIEFTLIEQLCVLLHSICAVLVNLSLMTSVILAINSSTRQHHNFGATGRAKTRVPVVDEILLLLSIIGLLQTVVHSGWQITCMRGECFFNQNF